MSTVDNIQSSVAGIVDLDQNTANISSDDYSLRLTYLNDRERKWAETGRYRVLYREYFTNTSTSTGNATVSLPADFRVEGGFPTTVISGTDQQLPIIRAQEKAQYATSSKYVYIMGDDVSGKSMVFHTGMGDLASGATIFIPYYANPSSLASPADKVMCPNPQYLIEGVVADVWRAREDARFQINEAKADQILANMLEYEMTPSEAAADDRVRTVEQTRYNFRWGR